MLAELFINNLVIIKRDHLFFDSGFNVLSGETGSGKSLILEAINIVLGKRTNKDIIGKFDDKTIIEAVFNLDEDIIKKLEDKDIDKEKDNKLIVSKDTICQTNVRRIIEEWNKLQEVGINPIRDIKPSSKRYQLLKGRIREYGIDEVLNAINNVRNSDFLRGENNRGWMITFDWFVKPNNFIKTLEGNYNKEGQHGTTRTAQRHVKPLIPFEQCGGSEISDTPFAD